MKHKIRQSVTVIGKGELCSKCGCVMQRRSHKYLTEKQKRGPFYYSEWDVCINPRCSFIKHYDHFKVWNNNDMATYAKSKEQEQNLLSLMRNF